MKGFFCPGKPGEAGYVYVKGLSQTDSRSRDDPRDLVFAYDKEGNHEGGRNVLTTIGRVQWMAEDKFQEALAKTKDYLEKKRSPRRE